jgi:CheY-like chemotaxis protein/nitrogen-specific signal transduction histidine kinase
VFDADQQIAEWVGVHIDITEARRTEDALREADQRKDEFLATLAHELRNPLAPIRTAARILLQPDVTAASVQSCAAILARQASHMALLLDDLLDVSRITSGRLELKKAAVTVRAIVEAAVEAARPGIAARGHHLIVSLPDEVIELNADSLRLSQVLTNLLNNAAKYTDPQGQITLGVRETGDGLQLTVTDNGIGIAPESLAQVFVMFSQVISPIDRSEGGLGIGLSLARGLVELHAGRLDAHSPGLGHGTTMTVHLPETLRVDRHSGASLTASAALAGKPASPKLSILVVDDNRDAADTLSMLLDMEGHCAVTAYSGASALTLARSQAFDAGILDIGMPGMNGYELAGHLRAMAGGAQLLLISLTGWGQEGDQQKALAAGFDRHISKPVNPELLLKGLNGWVATKRAGAAAPGASVGASAFSKL